MTPELKKRLWVIGGSVIASLITAATIWLVPYEVEHHKVTNDAAILIAQTDKDFREYMLFQEYRELLRTQRQRPLTELEQNRLARVTRELEKIRDSYAGR